MPSVPSCPVCAGQSSCRLCLAAAKPVAPVSSPPPSPCLSTLQPASNRIMDELLGFLEPYASRASILNNLRNANKVGQALPQGARLLGRGWEEALGARAASLLRQIPGQRTAGRSSAQQSNQAGCEACGAPWSACLSAFSRRLLQEKKSRDAAKEAPKEVTAEGVKALIAEKVKPLPGELRTRTAACCVRCSADRSAGRHGARASPSWPRGPCTQPPCAPARRPCQWLSFPALGHGPGLQCRPLQRAPTTTLRRRRRPAAAPRRAARRAPPPSRQCRRRRGPTSMSRRWTGGCRSRCTCTSTAGCRWAERARTPSGSRAGGPGSPSSVGCGGRMPSSRRWALHEHELRAPPATHCACHALRMNAGLSERLARRLARLPAGCRARSWAVSRASCCSRRSTTGSRPTPLVRPAARLSAYSPCVHALRSNGGG